MRRIRMLGLSVVLTLAVTALVGVTSASASFFVSSGKFMTSGATTSTEGSTNGYFIDLPNLGETIECKTTHFSNPELPKESITLFLFAESTACAWSAGTVTVDMNGCIFAFRLTQLNIGDAGIGCIDDESDGIKVELYFNKAVICTVTLPRQWSAEEGAGFLNQKLGLYMVQTTEGVEYTASGWACEGEDGSNGVISTGVLLEG